MANEFSKVSLGFAEFVSQLLHETFDAVLSAQNYQLEKYSELEKALGIPDETFSEMYLDEDDIRAKELEVFGVNIVEKMAVNEAFAGILKEIVKEPVLANIIDKGFLTAGGSRAIKTAVTGMLVLERKNKIRYLINHSQMAKLMVDSGEIKAKLELTNLYEHAPEEIEGGNTTKQQQVFTTKKTNDETKKAPTETIHYQEITRLIDSGKIRMKEISDPVSKQKTLLIDKASLQGNTMSSAQVPKIRLIATPIQPSSGSNLYSEVIIKFKTV